MTYNCPLRPPHVDSAGAPLAHKNRKECMAMGADNRGKAPPSYEVPRAPPESDGMTAPPGGAGAGSAPSGGTPAATKPKKGKFKIFQRKAEMPAEGSPEHNEQKTEEKWTHELSGDYTVMFWGTLMSLARGGVEFIDARIHAKHPFDTKQMEFTTSEEQMISDVMPGFTTRLLQKLGIKSAEGAERFIHGMVIIRVFGRIFVGLGIHYYMELKESGKEKKAARDAKAAELKAALPATPAGAPPPPEPETMPKAHPNPSHLTPAQMETMLRMGIKPEDIRE